MYPDMADWNSVRNEFPVCKKFIYLNAAGGSPVSIRSAGEAKRFYDEMLTGGDTCWDTWLERTEIIREKLARFIHAEKEEIAFTTNTSTAMNYAAAMLRGEGDVVTMEDEFPSSTFPWINQNYKLDYVKPLNSAYPVQVIEQSITSGSKIMVTSHVQYRTGFRQNLDKTGQLCKSKGLIYIVNATQSMGIFDIDVKQTGIDFLVFTGLKWACAGYGIAGLYISKAMLEKKRIPFAGWRSITDPELLENSRLQVKKEASAIECGCPHFPNIFALGGALDLFNEIGKEEVESRVLHLNKYLEKKLIEMSIPVILPASEENRSGICIIRCTNPEEIVPELMKKNIVVSARGEGLRISVNIYNNEEDIDILVSELSRFEFELKKKLL
jgi:cysteine desulfurase / selenocysteine lyase